MARLSSQYSNNLICNATIKFLCHIFYFLSVCFYIAVMFFIHLSFILYTNDKPIVFFLYLYFIYALYIFSICSIFIFCVPSSIFYFYSN